MTADLSAIIARLEAAEVGTSKLSFDVANACGEKFFSDVTASVDDALAMAGRAFPYWFWEISLDPQGNSFVQGCPEPWPEGLTAKDRGGVYVNGPSLPLALCIAILKAKAQGESNG
jgi:hypothetical protein